jgi:hypothetical protein
MTDAFHRGQGNLERLNQSFLSTTIISSIYDLRCIFSLRIFRESQSESTLVGLSSITDPWFFSVSTRYDSILERIAYIKSRFRLTQANEVTGLECHVSLSCKGILRPSFVPSHIKVPWVLVMPPSYLSHVNSVQKYRSTSDILQEDINEKCLKHNPNLEPPIGIAKWWDVCGIRYYWIWKFNRPVNAWSRICFYLVCRLNKNNLKSSIDLVTTHTHAVNLWWI